MQYLERLIDSALADALVSSPAVLVTGPRICQEGGR